MKEDPPGRESVRAHRFSASRCAGHCRPGDSTTHPAVVVRSALAPGLLTLVLRTVRRRSAGYDMMRVDPLRFYFCYMEARPGVFSWSTAWN